MTVRMVTLNGDTPEAWRLALSLFGHPSASGLLDRRGGLAPGTGAADLVGTTAMKATVAPFIAWVDGTSSTSQGGYIVHNDAALEVEFEPGEASVVRTDRVIIQVRDDAYDSSGATDARIVVLKGNSGGGAADLPPSSELLWEVNVPAGASVGGGGLNVSSARSDKRRWTAANGGMLVVKDAADLATLTPHEGMQVYRLDGKDPQIYRGGSWAWCGPPRTVIKGSDTGPRTTETFAADPHLTVTGLPGGAYYDLCLWLRYAAHSESDLKIGWTYPSGSIINWSIASKAGQLQPDGNTGTPAWDALDRDSEPRLGGWTTDLTSLMSATVEGTLYTGSGGDLTLRWAAAAAGVGATVKAASKLMLVRVG